MSWTTVVRPGASRDPLTVNDEPVNLLHVHTAMAFAKEDAERALYLNAERDKEIAARKVWGAALKKKRAEAKAARMRPRLDPRPKNFIPYRRHAKPSHHAPCMVCGKYYGECQGPISKAA